MAINQEAYLRIRADLDPKAITLIAVSKTKSVDDILALYELGQRDFGENYVQELVDKAEKLPKDIRWHFIGHLQTNKVKYLVPFVQLIQGIDSLKLLREVNKQAAKVGRKQDCLLQVYIAREESKFGLDEEELATIFKQLSEFEYVNVCGFMGMASFTEEKETIKQEFKILKDIHDRYKDLLRLDPKMQETSVMGYRLPVLSMGMSSDYDLAISAGSNMVRIGSLLFGEREYTTKRV